MFAGVGRKEGGRKEGKEEWELVDGEIFKQAFPLQHFLKAYHNGSSYLFTVYLFKMGTHFILLTFLPSLYT